MCRSIAHKKEALTTALTSAQTTWRKEAFMESIAISLIVFVFVFGGALLGMFLHTRLREHHLIVESKNVVVAGIGLVGTMSAIVLGMLISSAKGYYDTQNAELTQISANIVMLDRILAHYGPEAADARAGLRENVSRVLEQTWPKTGKNNGAPQLKDTSKLESLYEKIQGLVPKDDAHNAIKSQALTIVGSLGSGRWLMYEQSVNSISTPMLVILIFWLSIIFTSFGLFAPTNAITVTSLCVSALSVSSAIFLMLELYNPYQGLIQVSSAPLRAALERLGQ
jgi:hypothetical protein